MTAPTHVYVTAHGSYVSGAWVGESAQFGLRLCTAPDGSEPTRGEFFTPQANGDVVLAQGTQAGTHGTLTKTFDFRIGGVGSGVNWDANWQIDIAEDVWTFLDAVKGNLMSSFKWSHIKQVPVDSLGKAIGYSSTYTLTTPLAGVATTQLPPQNALAISLRAPVTGRRGRGRVYMPALAAATIGSDGTIGGAVGNAFRAAAVTLITNLEDPAGLPAHRPMVCIMSASSATAVRPTQVRTGNRIDTIRSRREQVAESYTATDL